MYKDYRCAGAPNNGARYPAGEEGLEAHSMISGLNILIKDVSEIVKLVGNHHGGLRRVCGGAWMIGDRAHNRGFATTTL